MPELRYPSASHLGHLLVPMPPMVGTGKGAAAARDDGEEEDGGGGGKEVGTGSIVEEVTVKVPVPPPRARPPKPRPLRRP